MRLRVHDVRLRDYHSSALFLDDDAFEELSSCPACAASDEQSCVATVEGRSRQSVQLAHCARCSHSYLSRRPNPEWFQRFYASEWDSAGRQGGRRRTVASLRTALQQQPLPRRAVRAARVLRRDVPGVLYPGPARLMQMVSGLGGVAGDAFPTGKKLLEIGSGYGAALSWFSEAGLQTWGTEASAHRVAACRAKGLNVVQTSILDLDPVVKDAPYDFVYSSHVVEHITDLDRLMEALHPLVADGGFVYIEVPHSPIAEDVLQRTHIPVHAHLFSASSLSTLLRRFGLQPVRVLADVNLHIVAQKTEQTGPLQDVSIPSRPVDLVHGLDLLDDASGPVRVRYNQYRVEISKVSDGDSLYSRRFSYGVHDVADDDHNEFVVEREDSSALLPLEIVHDSEQAPIWVK